MITRNKTNSAAVFRPSKPLILPNFDVKIDLQRRQKAFHGFTVITSVAHVWFNTFFESHFSSTGIDLADLARTHTSVGFLPETGVFSIPWELMDGVRGFTLKGARALDCLSIIWRIVPQDLSCEGGAFITAPQRVEPVADADIRTF